MAREDLNCVIRRICPMSRHIRHFLGAAALSLPWLLTPSSSIAQPRHELIIGVNQTRLAWAKPEERRQIISEIGRSGVQAVRITLQQPFENVVDGLALAQQQQLNIVLNISLNAKAYYDENVTQRSGGRVESAYPLSSINVQRFQSAFSKIWTEIEHRQIKLMAVEVGNEINWAFNGDVAAQNGGRTFATEAAIEKMPAFLRGLDKYIELLRIVHDLRETSQVNHSALILSAGMARVRPDFAASMGADVVDPGLTLSLLTQRGLPQYADAAAMHQYPVPSATPAERQRSLADALQDCRKGNTRGACWLTEWGISNNTQTCPLDDRSRANLVRETRQNLRREAEAGLLAAAFYFEWRGITSRSIWRCGGLTEAGQAAIPPEAAAPAR